MRLLIVDQDRDLVDMLTHLLKTYGHEVRRAYTSDQAELEWLDFLPDLVILDIAMKNTDGLTLCRNLQEKHDALVLVYTCSSDYTTEAHCLDKGADDFLAKPFHPQVLLAHIKAVSRRARATLKTRPSSVITVGPIEIDSRRNSAKVYGKSVKLTPTESKLLHLLAVNSDGVCTADQIVNQVWGYDDAGATCLIKSHIRRLREKLEPNASKPQFIVTVAAVGYMLVRQPLEAEPVAPASRKTGGQVESAPRQVVTESLDDTTIVSSPQPVSSPVDMTASWLRDELLVSAEHKHHDNNGAQS